MNTIRFIQTEDLVHLLTKIGDCKISLKKIRFEKRDNTLKLPVGILDFEKSSIENTNFLSQKKRIPIIYGLLIIHNVVHYEINNPNDFVIDSLRDISISNDKLNITTNKYIDIEIEIEEFDIQLDFNNNTIGYQYINKQLFLIEDWKNYEILDKEF